MDVVIYTKDWCGFCDRAKRLLDSKGVDYTEINVSRDREKMKEMIERSGGLRTAPQIFINDTHVGGSDELYALDEAGKLDGMLDMTNEKDKQDDLTGRTWNVAILGSGPAGLTSAIYAARANLEPLVIEGADAGGQLMITTDVENYPGFPDGILGPDLMKVWRDQAARFGTKFLTGNATKVDFSSRPFSIEVGDHTVRAKTLVISTGASARKIGLDSEKALWGRGVSYCATCDGFFFKEKRLVVVGGGDSAMEEATFLTKFASKVTIVHRRDELRASKIMQDRAKKNAKIDFVWDSVVEEVLGVDEGKVTGVKLKNIKSGEVTDFPCDGLFVAIGHTPNTKLFEGKLEMDSNGYIETKSGSTATSVPGVFASGDVMDHVYRQAVTAAGTGCMSAIDAERWLEANESD